jgi:L-iditol 2-dehydrogenase
VALTLPTLTRAAVYHPDGEIRLEVRPLRPPGPGEVLVRIRACGLCSGETMAWYMARKAPVPLGHEPVGEVAATGTGVEVPEGTRVFVHHHAPCGACRACRRGDAVHCPTWRRTRLEPGGLADYTLVPPEIVAADLLPLPEEVDDERGVFVEPLACAVKSLRRAGLREGDRVAVVGLGAMGLLHVLAARALGAAVVAGVDVRPDRLEVARALGAIVGEGTPAGGVAVGARAPAGVDAAGGRIDEALLDGGADVVVVTPPSPEAIATGMACTAPAGRLVLFAPLPPGATIPLPVHDLFFREVSLIPSYSAGPAETREALRLLAAGLPVGRLVTHRLPLERAAEGYRLVASGDALKVVVKP